MVSRCSPGYSVRDDGGGADKMRWIEAVLAASGAAARQGWREVEFEEALTARAERNARSLGLEHSFVLCEHVHPRQLGLVSEVD